MEIRCPSCKKKYVIRKPGRYKCRQCGSMLPDIRPSDLPAEGQRAASGGAVAGRPQPDEPSSPPAAAAARAKEDRSPEQPIGAGPKARIVDQAARAGAAPDAAPGAKETAAETAALEGPPPEFPPELAERVTDLEERIKRDPSAKAPYLTLGQLYVDAGRKDRAVAVFKRFLTIDPGNAYVKNRIEVLLGRAKPTKPVAYAPPVDAKAMAQTHEKARKVLIGAAVAVPLIVAAVFLKPVLFPSAKAVFATDRNANTPKWSPRGDAIAFIAQKSGGAVLCVFDLKRKQVREVADVSYAWGERSFAWSPDGTEIAFTSQDDEEGSYGEAVYVISLADGAKKKIAPGKAPSWSPFERSLAIVSTGPRKPDDRGWFDRKEETIYLADLVTQSLKKLSAKGADPSFSPKSNQIVFEIPEAIDRGAQDETGGGVDMAQVVENALSSGATTDLEARKGLAREMETVAHDAGSQGEGGSGMIMSPSNIYVVDSLGSAPVKLTSDNRSGSPVWTPDGERILYAYSPPGSPRAGAVWMMRPDGTDRRPLLGESIRISDPAAVALTPDGQKVVFEYPVENVNQAVAAITSKSAAEDLFVADVGGSEHVRLKNKHQFKHRFSLSPDGKRIAYEYVNPKSGISEIWMMSR